MYSIGQVAEMFGLPISTLRYYDKQGLFPNMERVSGIRKFGDTEIEALRVIECLKKAGMEIKDIRQFMDWCVEGPSTYPQRKALFEEQRSHMEAELEQMNRTLDMLKFKCWYYEQASYAALGKRRGIFRQNQTIRSTERLAMRVFICFSDSVRQMVRNQCL